MNELTGFQRDVLYIIAGLNEPNGIEIKDHLEAYYETPVDRGQLYPNIDTIVEEGFIEKNQQATRGNAYALTIKGHREIAARREWEDEHIVPEA